MFAGPVCRLAWTNLNLPTQDVSNGLDHSHPHTGSKGQRKQSQGMGVKTSQDL